MRVLHVIPAVAPRYGGPSVAVHAMAQALQEAGVSVTVATTDSDGAARLPVPVDQPVIRDGVEYRFFSRTLPGEWKFSWPMSRWLHQEVGRFDVVHVHSVFCFTNIPACRAAARRGVPYVVRPLGTLDPWSLRQSAWKKRPYFSLVERPLLRGADAIHVTSEAEARSVDALGFADRVRIVPLGVGMPAQRCATGRPVGEVARLIFLSRLHPKKGLPLLLRALADLQKRGGPVPELHVAGSGEPAYEAELRQMTRQLGLAERVTFLGHLDGDAKHAALASADLFVLPSYQENFGIAVAEALAAGLPVLISDQVALASQVKASGAGVVVPPDERAIADALDGLLSDPELRARMGRSALALAESELSWRNAAAQLLQLYHDVRSSRSSVRSA